MVQRYQINPVPPSDTGIIYFFTFLPLLRLQVGILVGDVWDAGAILPGVEIVMTHDQCTRIAAVKVL